MEQLLRGYTMSQTRNSGQENVKRGIGTEEMDIHNWSVIVVNLTWYA